MIPKLPIGLRPRFIATLVAASAAVALAARQGPAAATWPRGVRLVRELPRALEVPPAPPLVELLRLDRLPDLPGRGPLVIPLAVESERPFVARARLRGGATFEMAALDAADAAAFGTAPRRVPRLAPGRPLGACFRSAPSPSGISTCQRFDNLRNKESVLLLVFGGPASAVSDVEVGEAELPATVAPAAPALRPLVRHLSVLSPAGASWRDSLIGRDGDRYVFELVLPPRGELLFATGLESGDRGGPVRFLVRLDGSVALDEVVRDRAWHDHRIPLPGQPGRGFRLELETRALPGESRPARGAWAAPRVLEHADRPSILLVTLDAVRADHLSAYGYPRDTSPTLAAIAHAGARFTRAVAQAPATWESIAALLSGLHPGRTGVRLQGSRIPATVSLLPDLLSERGYDTIAGADLASFPPLLLGRFDDEDRVVMARYEPAALVAGTLKQLPGIARRLADRPTFAWLHLENAHYPLRPREPFRYDPGYRGRFANTFEKLDTSTWEALDRLAAGEMRHVEALYDASIRDADDVLRQIVLALDAAGATERTLLIVTADHGELVGERGFTLEHSLSWDPVLRVPLIVAWPGKLPAGLVVEQRVQHVDLVPTILALAGVEAAPGLDGRDLSPLLRGGTLPDRPAYAEVAAFQHVQYRGDEKLVTAPPGFIRNFETVVASSPQRSLYDLAADPAEKRDLAQERIAQLEEALALLKRELRRQQETAVDVAPAAPLGQAALQALHEAGYLRRLAGAPRR